MAMPENYTTVKLGMLTSSCRVRRLVGSMKVRTLVTLVQRTIGKILPALEATLGGRQMRSSCAESYPSQKVQRWRGHGKTTLWYDLSDNVIPFTCSVSEYGETLSSYLSTVDC